jgi:HNH endonuclease
MTARAGRRLRDQVRRRARGRCEYCLIHEDDGYARHQLDHITAIRHGGETSSDNLALACFLCNRHKGSDVAALDPDTGEVVRLFDPRRQRWGDHFELHGAMILPLTPTGRVTVSLLRLNAPERVIERNELLKAGRYGPGQP